MDDGQSSETIKEHVILAAIASVVLVIDIAAPLGVSAGILYVVVILAALVSKKSSTPIIWASICTVLTLVGYYASPLGGELWNVTINRALTICAIWAVTVVSIFLLERTKKVMSLESDLKLSEFRSTLGEVAEYASDAIVITDEKGFTKWVNKGFTDISGYSLDEVKGQKPGDVLQGKGTELEDIKRLSEAIKEAQPIELELLNYHKNGKPYWIDLSINPVFEQNKLVRFVAVERDITHRKQLEEKLAERASTASQATDNKSRFMTLMTHELSTPINSILTTTQKIKETVSSQDMVEHASHIHQSGEIIHSIIRNIITLSNIDINTFKVCRENVDVNEIFASISDDIRQLAKCGEIECIYENKLEEGVFYNSDKTLIHHIFYFFALNAISHVDKGSISLVMKPSDFQGTDTLQFEIKATDNGKSYQEMLVTNTSSLADNLDVAVGVAVGYQIASKVVSKLGGVVILERSTQGETKVTIKIPSERVTTLGSRSGSVDIKRIMIAEDNRVNAMVLTKMLQSLGFTELDLAKNGAEAVNLAKQHSYYAIFMDNHMPEMTGIEATRIIKQSIEPDARIIGCTADTDPISKQELLELGVENVLFKPLDKKKLISILENLERESDAFPNEQAVGES